MIKEVYKNKRGKTAICICDNCGKEFKRGYFNSTKYKNQFCSIICRPQNRKERISVNCDYCGKKIEITPYRKSISKKHFCNYKCYLLKNQRIKIVKCDFCGNKVTKNYAD